MPPAAAILVAAFVAVLTAIVCRSAWERSNRRRLAAALDRMDLMGTDHGPSSTTDELLTAIERAVRDVIATRDAEEKKAGRIRQALDCVSLAVLIFEADGTLVHANSAAFPFLQARHGDAIVGAALMDVVAESLEVGNATTTIELFGPPRRIVEISADRFGEGTQVAVVATVGDVTDRHHLEEVRADLVANISHELKTPVGAIGLLAETIEGETDPAVMERLAGRIGDEAMRLASIVDDLLDLSRIEAFDGLDGRTVRLADVIAESVERFRPVADRAGVTIDVRGSASDVVVAGDRSQLVSALANLIDNAVKYSDRGSEVEVSVSTEGVEAFLRVSDQGMGIPARDLDRIFERFYRVDQARSRDTGGSGLGLSIVRHVARNHGGRVDVSSRLGEGSTFLIAIPVLDAGERTIATSVPQVTARSAEGA